MAAPDTNSGVFSDPYISLLTSGELGEYLRKSARTVRRMAKLRIIPAYHVGGALRFRLAEVEEALKRYRVKEVS